MATMTRCGVSLKQGLLDKFDAYIRDRGYRNRSAALRDVVRDFLVTREWQTGEHTIAAVVSLVYNHDARDVLSRLQKIKTQYRAHVLSCMQHPVHEQYSLDVIVLSGPARTIKRIADQFIGCRGVIHGTVTPTTPGPPCG